jgi:hypothetical protein
MRRAPFILAVSLAANAALAFALWKFPATDATSSSSNRPANSQSSANTTPGIPHDKIWTHLAVGADDARFVAHLRTEGFPERVIRVLLDYRLNERFIAEIRELNTRHQIPYWRNDTASRWNLTPEAYARFREIEQHVAEQKRLLLGPSADAFQPGDFGEPDRRRYGDFPPEKISALKAIEKDYRELSNRIDDDNQGITLEEDREKLAFLEKQKQDDIARLLTPDELEQYKRRSSSAAYFARNQLQFLDPTEDEFLALYRLRQDFDTRFGVSHLSREQSERRRSAEPEFESQIAALLGPDRFADYQITNDKNYQETRAFITEAGLPSATTRQLVAIQRESTQQADAIKADKALTSEVRDQKLAALRQTALDKASSLLGRERAASLESYKAGRWLAQIAPTPARPKP